MLTKMNKRLLISLLIIAISLPAVSQITKGSEAFPEFYHDRLPSTRAESMGRAGVCLGGDEFSVWSNPAGISMLKGMDLNIGYSNIYQHPYDTSLTPFEDANFQFYGFATRINNLMSVGINRNEFTRGENIYRIDPDSVVFDSLVPKFTSYTFTLGIQPMQQLYIGVNFNYTQGHPLYGPYYSNQRPSGFSFDLGAIWRQELSEGKNHRQYVDGGVSLANTTFSEIHYSSFAGFHQLPANLRLGAGWHYTMKNKQDADKPHLLDASVTTEFQTIIGYQYRTAYRAGAEILLYELLALRAGYYSESVNPDLFSGGTTLYKSQVGNLTYGAGLEVPLNKFTDGNIPLDIKFDFANLPSTTFLKEKVDTKRYNSMNFSIYYPIPKFN